MLSYKVLRFHISITNFTSFFRIFVHILNNKYVYHSLMVIFLTRFFVSYIRTINIQSKIIFVQFLIQSHYPMTKDSWLGAYHCFTFIFNSKRRCHVDRLRVVLERFGVINELERIIIHWWIDVIIHGSTVINPIRFFKYARFFLLNTQC
jgi:hypothetical protein